MDDSEKRVLRRKNLTLAASYVLTKDRIKELQDAQLITARMRKLIECETDRVAKMTKFIELYVSGAGPNGFQDMCGVLGVALPLLADELRAELRVERGTLKVDDYVQREAAILVKRRYGHLVRLPDSDKKQFEDLIASRTQCAKETWRIQLEIATRDLELQEGLNNQKEERIRAMVDRLNDFKRMNCGDQPGSQDNEGDGVSNLQTDSSIEDKLAAEVNAVQGHVLKALPELQHVMMEKARAFCYLELDDTTAKLDNEVTCALEELTQELKKTREDSTEESKKANALSTKLSMLKLSIEKQLAHDDMIADNMRKRLRDYLSRIQEADALVGRLCRKEEAAAKNAVKHRVKAELLGKNRNMGYVYEKGLTRPDEDLPDSVLVEATTLKFGQKKIKKFSTVRKRGSTKE